MTQTPNRFGTFFQIGYVTRDIGAAVKLLTDGMGATLIDLLEDFRDPQGNPVVIRSLSHLMLGKVEIEVIEPRLDQPSIYLDALPQAGETVALHHLGYRHADIASWEAAMAALRATGVDVPMEGATARARFAYIDTRCDIGHFTEVVYRAEA